MKEYIERDAASRLLRGECIEKYPPSLFTYGLNAAAREISKIPTADVVEVIHAKWDNNGRCTNCGGHAPFMAMSDEYYESPYCFVCGAKMDKETP